MDLIPDFIHRMHGGEFEYLHPLLEGVLEPTYGIMVYQEQVMQAAQICAGYTLGGADLLRRAMGKKKPEEMVKQRQIFLEGAAEKGIDALEAHVDSLIIIPNQRLLSVYGDISMKDAYKKADDVLLNAVRSIFDLVVNRGHINLDFADLKTAMSTRGYAMMGAGLGRGEDRARQAAEQAIRSPLLDNVNIINAKGVLINITGGDDITLRETEIITDVVNQIVDLDEGEIFYGTVFDPDARDELRVTVIATGLTRNASEVEHKKRSVVAPTHAAPVQVAPQAVDEDDVPAISKRTNVEVPVSAAPNSTPRSSPMSIQDYLKNQQRK